MANIPNTTNYTIRSAAIRVNRSTRTIKQWIRDGMTCREVAGMVVIEHGVLITQMHLSMKANPSRKVIEETP